MKSYDDRQIDKPLTICPKCSHWFYKAAVLCAFCGEGYRTVQQVPQRRTDVSGNQITGP
jgi:hypothetical protein